MNQMDDEALRALVRQVVARQLGAGGAPEGQRPFAMHPSHARYVLPKTEGPCLIEPGVHCNRCGYCESLGH